MAGDWDEPAEPHAVAEQFDGARGRRRTTDLPEVKLLKALGYHLMDPGAIQETILTALWPPEHRVWVPDRTERIEKIWRSDGWRCTRPLTPEGLAEIEQEVNNDLRAAGMPSRPSGRLWFVRLPLERRSLTQYLLSLQRRADKTGVIDVVLGSTNADWVALMRRLIAEDFAGKSES